MQYVKNKNRANTFLNNNNKTLVNSIFMHYLIKFNMGRFHKKKKTFWRKQIENHELIKYNFYQRLWIRMDRWSWWRPSTPKSWHSPIPLPGLTFHLVTSDQTVLILYAVEFLMIALFRICICLHTRSFDPDIEYSFRRCVIIAPPTVKQWNPESRNILSRLRGWKRTRTQMQEVKGLLFRIIKQTNKNYPVGEKQTGWLDKAGQGRTRQDKAGQGWTRLDKAGQDKAGQDKAGPDTDDI